MEFFGLSLPETIKSWRHHGGPIKILHQMFINQNPTTWCRLSPQVTPHEKWRHLSTTSFRQNIWLISTRLTAWKIAGTFSLSLSLNDSFVMPLISGVHVGRNSICELQQIGRFQYVDVAHVGWSNATCKTPSASLSCNDIRGNLGCNMSQFDLFLLTTLPKEDVTKDMTLIHPGRPWCLLFRYYILGTRNSKLGDGQTYCTNTTSTIRGLKLRSKPAPLVFVQLRHSYLHAPAQ